jgi:Flp pilus assembly protein TadD
VSPGSTRAHRSPPGLLVAASLLLVTIAAYWSVFDAGFVWDDDDYVTANETLRSLHGLRRIWTEPGAVPQYYPLTFTTLWVEYHLWGLDPRGYHVTNVLLHAASASLVVAVLVRLGVAGALVTGALFALHPVHVESVAWVAERKNVLSGVFYLTALLLYLPRVNGAAMPAWRYPAALAAFAAALLSKTVTCTWPVVVVMLAWWRQGRWPSRVARNMVPALVMGLAAGLLTVWMERHHVGAEGADWDLSLAGRLLVAGRVPWFYLGSLVLPVRLSFIYPRWAIDPASLLQWAFPLATIVALGALLALRARLGAAALVAALYFLVTLAPAAGFVNVYPMRYSFVADHFQYLASLGPLAVAGALLWRFGPAPGAVVAFVLAAVTATRVTAFTSAETLWRDTIAKNPHASMPRLNLGLLLQQEGRVEEAIVEYEHAVREHPDEADLLDNLAIALAGVGRTTEAIAHWRRALALAPERAGTHGNLGNTLAATGDLAGAIAEYETALRLDPTHADVLNNLGNVLAMQGRQAEALARYQAAIRADPRFAQAHENLGKLYLAAGRGADAAHEFRAAITLGSSSAEVWQALARLEAGQQRFAEARTLLERALVLRKDDATIRHDLGGVLQALGALADAVTHLREAVRLAPADPDLRNDLGVALANAGDRAAAATEFREALRLAPGHQAAAANLHALEGAAS